jgi:flavorubredoxin
VTYGGELRRKVKNFVNDWAKNAEDRTKYRFDLFIDGVDKLSAFDARFLATGHGPVLNGQIQEFLREATAMATECNDAI